MASVGIVEVIPWQIWCQTAENARQASLVQMELNLIERKVSEPMPIEHRVENEINGIEDERPINAHSCLTPGAFQPPSIESARRRQSQVDRAMLDQLRRGSGWRM